MKIIQERIGNNIKVTLEGTNGLLNYVVVAQQAANTAVAAKDDAEAAELAAINAQNAAESAEQGAQTAEQNAVNAETQAKEWAENPEDAPISPGEFSALHYAAKADEQRQLAETAKQAAEQAEADAVTAKNAAQTAQTNAETAETGAVTAKNAAQSAKNAAEQARDAAQQSETNAAASATAASNSATAASTSETNAATSETNAKASEDEAEKWAENPEDVEVEPGKYSALHHAAKAKDSEDAVAGIMDFTDGNVYQGNGAGIYALSREEFGRQKELFVNSPLLVHARLIEDWGDTNSSASLGKSETYGLTDGYKTLNVAPIPLMLDVSFSVDTSTSKYLCFALIKDQNNYYEVKINRAEINLYENLGGVKTLIDSTNFPFGVFRNYLQRINITWGRYADDDLTFAISFIGGSGMLKQPINNIDQNELNKFGIKSEVGNALYSISKL